MLKLLRHALLALVIVFTLSPAPEVWSEYGDVVLNRRSEKAGMAPVVFPHWFHRVRFRCKVCHSELGFEMRAGANDVTMNEIVQGKFCGRCHNGEIAWSDPFTIEPEEKKVITIIKGEQIQ